MEGQLNPPGLDGNLRHDDLEEDLSEAAQNFETEGYPPLAAPANCAKGWDPALLQNCTLARLRQIAKEPKYEGIQPRLNKPELYIALFNKMNDDQECDSCTGGNCDPTTHYFAPIENPPPGWVRGADGLFTKPNLSTSLSNPHRVDPSLLQTPAPGVNTGAGTSSSAQQPHVPVPPTINTNVSSPGSFLLRPSGSLDLPVGSVPNPVVSGIVQHPPKPRDPAQVIRDGVAATAFAHLSGAATITTSSTSGPNPLTSASSAMQERLRRQAEEAEQRRVAEIQELERQAHVLRQQQEQDQAAVERQWQIQFEADQRAREQAHQLKIQQLRASLATPRPPAPSFLAPPAAPASLSSPSSQFFPPPPSTASAAASHFTFGGHSASPSFFTTNSPGGFTSHVHSPHTTIPSPQVNPAAPLPLQPGSPAASLTPAQVETMIEQRFRALSQQAGSPHAAGPVHIHDSGICAEKGKPIAHDVVNPHMASRLGILAQPTFEAPRDLSSTDMSKMKKILTPGYDEVGSEIVLRQARWPHKLLPPTIPGYRHFKHKDLTFHMLVAGIISKILTETPMERMDRELTNKLLFLEFLVRTSFNYEHKVLLEASFETIMSWQNRLFEWTDPWDSIEESLKAIRGRHDFTPQRHTFTLNLALNNRNGAAGALTGGGAGGGGGGGNSQQQKQRFTNGVPHSYMKAHFICIKFNSEDGCNEKSSHNIKNNSDVILKHFCAGCHAKNKTEDAHSVYSCKKGPFRSLFRGW